MAEKRVVELINSTGHTVAWVKFKKLGVMVGFEVLKLAPHPAKGKRVVFAGRAYSRQQALDEAMKHI